MCKQILIASEKTHYFFYIIQIKLLCLLAVNRNFPVAFQWYNHIVPAMLIAKLDYFIRRFRIIRQQHDMVMRAHKFGQFQYRPGAG